MKVLTKLIITAATLTATAAGVVSAEQINKSRNLDMSSFDEGETYEVSSHGFDMKVDKKSLYFEISKNGQTWSSGKKSENDPTQTFAKQDFLESPVSIFFRANDGVTEGEYYLNDENHYPYNRITFKEKTNGFTARISTFHGQKSNPNLSLTFNLNVLLNSKGVDISITDLEEHESSSKLSGMVIYPGFGSSYGLNNGYFLIPDGSGALIDLSKKTNASSALNLVCYDNDFGISTITRKITSSQILSLPMYAIQNETNGLMAKIDNGAEYSSLFSKVAGIDRNDYNYMYFKFNYRDFYYSYQGVSESSKRSLCQEERNEMDPTISYYLYDRNMKYYEYAQEYQNILVSNNLLKKSDNLKANTRLEYLMSENEPGLFGNEIIKMTSLDYVKNSVDSLEGNNYTVSLLGYSKGGLSGSYPNNFPVEGKLGTKHDFKKLSEHLESKGIKTNYVVDFVRAYENSKVNNKDLAMNKSQKYITSSDYYNGTQSMFNRLTLGATKDRLESGAHTLNELEGSGFDFMSIGNALYSNHFNKLTTRSDAIKEYKDMLSSFVKDISLRKPNLYMFDNFDNYLSMPLESSHFLIETDDVPFLQMVLAGYKNMFVNSINLNYTNENMFLNLIDFGVLPSYLVTEKDPIELKNSPSTNIYSSSFSDWKEDITKTYEKVTQTLANVTGAKFIEREMVAPNIYRCKYDNGKIILINYSNSDYVYESKTVSAKGYLIYEG